MLPGKKLQLSRKNDYNMRLYLINPYNSLVSVVKSTLNRWNRYTVWKPLGLLVIAGLTPPEWEITIIDENIKLPDYETMTLPDLVGITAFTSQANRAYTIAKLFRDKGIPVVMGGIHATMCSTEAAQYVDSIVTGEAENIWPSVLIDFKNGSLNKLYAGNQTDLENVPIPRHDLLPSGYLFGSIQTTRGCPLSCNFCSVTAFNGKHYRRRPVQLVIEEYRQIREKLVLVTDDNFIGTRTDHIAHTKQLLQAMIDSRVRKKWIAQVTINFGDDEELLTLAAKAGCIGVFIGFESISDEGLLEIHKKYNIRKEDDIKSAIRRIHHHGISIVGSFIIGLDIDQKNIGLNIATAAQRYELDALNVLFLTPLPGTSLWNEMKSADRIILKSFPHDWKYYTLTFPVARYNNLSWSDMIREKETCYRSFYAYSKILRRVLNNFCQMRNPFVTVVSNLWSRRNTLFLDRAMYEKFDTGPGENPKSVNNVN